MAGVQDTKVECLVMNWKGLFTKAKAESKAYAAFTDAEKTRFEQFCEIYTLVSTTRPRLEDIACDFEDKDNRDFATSVATELYGQSDLPTIQLVAS